MKTDASALLLDGTVSNVGYICLLYRGQVHDTTLGAKPDVYV